MCGEGMHALIPLYASAPKCKDPDLPWDRIIPPTVTITVTETLNVPIQIHMRLDSKLTP